MAISIYGRTYEDQYGTEGNDSLEGGATNDALFGLGGDDTLTGHGGNDYLEGGQGADTLIGGTGNDIYVVTDLSDVIIENAGEGLDWVWTNLAAFSLASLPHIEGLAGDVGDEHLTGNDNANFIDGWLGADTMIGGLGDDTYFVDNVGDSVVELSGEGIDTIWAALPVFSLEPFTHVENLSGDETDQQLTGNDGNNKINGRYGADTMIGLGGNDTYVVDDPFDVVVEAIGEGSDFVLTSVSYALAAGAEVETLRASGTSDIDLTGNEFAQTISGNAGANAISGDGGDDYLLGYAGNDTLSGGDGADHLRGGTGNDVLTGGSGNDRLRGEGGADHMDGGAGNDIYYVDNALDTVSEAAGSGTDQILTSVDYTLAAGAEVEKVSTSNRKGTDGIDLTGNEFGQQLHGNAGANVLSGGGGKDYLWGYGGNDTLNGGAGSDVLSGGDGADLFWFDSELGGVDRIRDFSVADDTIVLDQVIFSALTSTGTLSASAFHAGTSAQDADDHIIYDSSTGRIYYDADGVGGQAQVLFAQVTAGLALTHEDFSIFGGL